MILYFHQYLFFLFGFSLVTSRISPPLQIAYRSQDVLMNCLSATQVQWYKKGSIIPFMRKNIKLNSLVLRTVSTKDSGSYICYGHHWNQTKFTATSRLFVGCKFK